jgi:hypothetical protein
MSFVGARYPEQGRGPEYARVVTPEELYNEFIAFFDDTLNPVDTAMRDDGMWTVSAGFAYRAQDPILRGSLLIIGKQDGEYGARFRAQVARRGLVSAKFEYHQGEGRYVIDGRSKLGQHVWPGNYTVMYDLLTATRYSQSLAEGAARLVASREAL